MNIRRLLFGIFMLAAWLLFVGRLGGVWLAAGAILAVIGELLFSRMFSNDAWLLERYQVEHTTHFAGRSSGSGVLGMLCRIGWSIGFLPVLAYGVVTAGLYIALLALRPRMELHPGIVRIKGRVPNVAAVTVMATCITLSPGTLTVDYDPRSDDLYVHWITVTERDPARIDNMVVGSMRSWLRRIFG